MNPSYNFVGSIKCINHLQVTLSDSTFGSSDMIRLPRNGGFAKGEVPPIPYLPGSTVRGPIRHAMHAVVMRAQKGDSEKPPFTLAEHFMLAQGVDVDNLTAKEASATSVAVDPFDAVRKTNPALSIMGRWGLGGHLGVGPGLPRDANCVCLLGGGARTIMFERNPDLLNELEESEIQRLKRLLAEQADASAKKKELKKEKDALLKLLKTADGSEKADINQQIKEKDDEIKSVKDAKVESKESVRRVQDRFEAFAAGTVFDHQMSLVRAPEIELGLMLATLREFARLPLIGGKHAYDCGKVEGSWAISSWAPDANAPVLIGSVSFDANGFHVEGEALEKALAVWEAAAKDVSGAGLDFRKFTAKQPKETETE